MSKNIYVGNMSYNTTETALRELFEEYGEVISVNVITDRQTGRPRGFAFVEMEDDGAANTAIAELNGQELDGRTLTVNEARPRPPRSGGERGGDRGGGRGGRGGGRGGGGRRYW
jgi:RNA recognition motif-containing protein